MRKAVCLGLFCLIGLLSGCGYRVSPPDITSLQTPVKPLKREETIIVDAGHGGKDGGASSLSECYLEKELNLKTARLVAHCLKQLGYQTIMTRNQDIFIPLKKRAEIANAIEADLFVSIHHNYSPNHEAKGVEIYYYKEAKDPPSNRIVHSQQLGDLVLKRMIAQTGAHSRGLKQADFSVIRETDMPAILIEVGFLSHPGERNRIQDPRYQRSIAWGIACGIDCYFKTQVAKK